jgi:hypothetical protein
MRTGQLFAVAPLLLAACAVAAGEVYYDYAPVSWVEPVTRSVGIDSGGPCPAGPGVEREAGEGGIGVTGMVEAIGAFIRQARDAGCAVARAPVERVVAYRVGYVYAGEDYVRVLDRDPGNRVRVRVRLEARP